MTKSKGSYPGNGAHCQKGSYLGNGEYDEHIAKDDKRAQEEKEQGPQVLLQQRVSCEHSASLARERV
jgi:hypothetical protein